MVPEKVGAYFYTNRKEPGAKERRKAFFKYMMKIDFAQQAMQEIRQRQGVRLAELPDSRRGILEWLAEMVGYGEWLPPATAEKILEMLHNAKKWARIQPLLDRFVPRKE